MSHSIAFPNYLTDIDNKFLESMVDLSYKNDVCPSFLMVNDKGEKVSVWIESADIKQRENEEEDRFYVFNVEQLSDDFYDFQLKDVILTTNDINELKEFLTDCTIKGIKS